eukprot:5607709-Pyramimonas_sp.AAC.1
MSVESQARPRSRSRRPRSPPPLARPPLPGSHAQRGRPKPPYSERGPPPSAPPRLWPRFGKTGEDSDSP